MLSKFRQREPTAYYMLIFWVVTLLTLGSSYFFLRNGVLVGKGLTQVDLQDNQIKPVKTCLYLFYSGVRSKPDKSGHDC